MTYSLQMLRALINAHPDRAGRLQVHVDALEATIEREPERCLERVRALFEAMFHSIAPHLGLAFEGGEEFPAQSSRIIKTLDFALEGHPDSKRIGDAIKKLVGSINGTIGALAELSNIRGMRHGGSLDWRTLQRQHAVMLGGLCDTLVSFLFDIAWSRAGDAGEDQVERYEDFSAFNDWFDEEYGSVEVVGSVFPSSLVLYQLDNTQYDAIREEWTSEAAAPAEEEAA
jgi:hypothetical protein